MSKPLITQTDIFNRVYQASTGLISNAVGSIWLALSSYLDFRVSEGSKFGIECSAFFSGQENANKNI